MKLVLAALLLAACGTPSSFDLCNTSCDTQGRCDGLSPGDVMTCKAGCDAMKSQLNQDDTNCDQQCTNCAAIRQALSDCTSKPCDQIQACVQAAPGCNPKTQQ